MIYYLYTNRSTVPTTNRIIHLLIKYTINTCLLEALCTVPCLAIWITKPDTLVYTPFYFLLIRLYSCSLLCSLNNRDHLRDMSERMEPAVVSTFQAAHGPYTGDPTATKSSHGTSHDDTSILATPPTPFIKLQSPHLSHDGTIPGMHKPTDILV
ncbi:unnamed protein product [Peniophora sp. CBMAI 1063]|nr:unnamed protein product [Peniophora sp. CBMAI 1063]